MAQRNKLFQALATQTILVSGICQLLVHTIKWYSKMNLPVKLSGAKLWDLAGSSLVYSKWI